VAREAKAIRPSAWVWVKKNASPNMYGFRLAAGAVARARSLREIFMGDWLVRRLAPDCSRIELATLPEMRDEARLLYSMGWETANMHLGSPRAIGNVKRDMAARRGRWLHKGAKAMFEALWTTGRTGNAVGEA